MQGCIPRLMIDRAVPAIGIRSLFAILFLVFGFAAHAADVPATWIDDAQLHDVQLVGSKFAIAVGEHGAIWKSTDGAKTWSRLDCGLDVSLRSVCFLDDRTGWIAGSDDLPYSGQETGILLSTRDGGQSWQRLGQQTLPSLSYVKFFGLDEGVVVGRLSPIAPAGIFKTTDGGQTWQGIQGDAPQSWKAACFVEPHLGVVAGINGRVSLMGGEQLFGSKLPAQGMRSIRTIKLLPNESGWLAGDGGLALKTSNGGVTWEPPAMELPEELRDGMDFRSVEVRGEKVWLAGSPGSVIWHSPNNGQNWIKQSTGQPIPISSIRFPNDQLGVAVGAFGVILRTDDGGKTWQAVRGSGRRSALLALHARPTQTSAPLLTKLSGELGYRSTVWVAQRTDVGPLSLTSDGESRLQAAVQKCGGHHADIHWQLPLTVPGLEFSSDKLLVEWQKQTEGRLPQTLLGGLVRQIRTWRPNIVVIDQPASDDAASQLLFDASLRAVGQASDATRYIEQTEFTGLAAWNVDRVYVRLAAGGTGDAHIDLDEFLPYLKTSTRLAASSSIALLQGAKAPQSEQVENSRTAYRWLGLDGKPAQDSATGRTANGPSLRSRDFFGGLSISPGSAARRDMIPMDEANTERLQKLVQKQRNITAISQKSLDDPRMAGQMLGQINGIVEGMDARQAAIVLHDLATEYRKRSQFELVEATYVEIVKRYPQEPAALDASRWLIQFWTSSETAWQRSRIMTTGSGVNRTRIDQNVEYVDQALSEAVTSGNGRKPGISTEGPALTSELNTASPVRLAVKLDFDSKPSADKKAGKSNRMKVTQSADWRSESVSGWQERAIELAKRLETTSPNLYRSTEIQFPLAALRRSTGTTKLSDAIMRGFVTNAIDPETKQLAERELWVSFATAETPQAITTCSQVTQRPHLDGLLSDACWENAREIRLSAQPLRSTEAASGSSEDRATMALFAYDAEFLYVAFSVPGAEGTPRDKPQLKGRQRDADLSRHDRISIRLDLDRDYTTWYEFHVDQRGWTAESCWEDRRWNPTWYVAAEADEADWRIEAAIPWSELAPVPPHRGTIYGLSVLRTIPTVGLQSWTHPAKAQPQPSSFGFLKFE